MVNILHPNNLILSKRSETTTTSQNLRAAKWTKRNESSSTAVRELPMASHQDTAANTVTYKKMPFKKTTTITHYVTAPESISVNSVPTRLSITSPHPTFTQIISQILRIKQCKHTEFPHLPDRLVGSGLDRLLVCVPETYFPILFQLAQSVALESGSHRCRRPAQLHNSDSLHDAASPTLQNISVKQLTAVFLKPLKPAAYTERFGYQQEVPSNDASGCFVAAVLSIKEWSYVTDDYCFSLLVCFVCCQ